MAKPQLIGLSHLKYKIKRNRCCGQIRFLDGRSFDVIDFSVQLRKS